ncbi:LLM class flavin-dependent oxidoreductase [Streptosporangium saharense]|uniref:Alkanesulfonate monooxygenase SsuD/methylene tetrahydromethanopterin reductase-like flavin-dependent oxidoreductase (Luciferase family) n=1 Tax=Streptosporangium saharense TaxID=1706840 RepID=A0A7W7QP33_9ACTN|nr:LLM class flavin-dependent oxidoreductase [Streptosporangium saharense]MBB4917137.1 alkanesulfonate monooxygenase SsuD/methylene tetrahydromethanopterin reductase-like flavin-dependent oxidoreductase (luciferase family) [Streptosporangium saharense]
MRVGIFLVAAGFPGREPGQVLRDTVDAVVAAEEAGFDDAWIAEHHFMSYGVCPSAVTLAGVALGRTSRIGVGTAVSVLSARHPVELAEQAAILDQVSGGRFTLGVGRGGPWLELEVFGMGLPRFERGFPESLDLLCAALGQDTVSADGEFFRFREVPMVPAVRLRPVVACTSPGTVALAAERGLPMLLGMHLDDEGRAGLLREYGDAHGAAHGGACGAAHGDIHGDIHGGVCGAAHGDTHGICGGHVAAVVGHVGDSTREAVAELRAAMPGWLGPGLAGYVPVDGRPTARRDVADYVDFLCRTHPVGSADLCVERIERTVARTGLSRLILMVEGAGSRERTLDTIRRLGAEVLPRIRKTPSSDRGTA